MKNKEYFTEEFQYNAVKALMEDRELIGAIYPVLDQNYFSDASLKLIVAVIKDYYKETGRTPDYTTLDVKCMDKSKGRNYGEVSTAIMKVKATSSVGIDAIKEHMIKFFTLKEILRMGREIEDGIKMEEGTDTIIKKTMKQIDKITKIGESHVVEANLTKENFYRSLSSGDNETITTGIPEIDEGIGGGLRREDIGLFVAPTGFGKTTMATVLAQNAAIAGYKVLQIFFEDKPDDILRKHIAKALNSSCDRLQKLTTEQIDTIVKQLDSTIKNRLKMVHDNVRLVKMADGETTVEDIEEEIRRNINNNFRPDLVIIDYFSSLKHSTNEFKKIFESQPRCMRKIKELAYKYNIGFWVMQQTNRTAVSKDGDTETMGNFQGSFEATQPCSVYLTLERSPEQKANGRANIVFNKTRHSQPQHKLDNIVFNNARLIVEMDEQSGPADAALFGNSFQTQMAKEILTKNQR